MDLAGSRWISLDLRDLAVLGWIWLGLVGSIWIWLDLAGSGWFWLDKAYVQKISINIYENPKKLENRIWVDLRDLAALGRI